MGRSVLRPYMDCYNVWAWLVLTLLERE